MSLDSIHLPILVSLAYLLGSVPFGLLLARFFGRRDVRQHGSGNIGATNVLRVAGPIAGFLTLALDVGKGAAAVGIAGRVSHHDPAAMMSAGLAALIGHCFPVWLRFKGGKGVATALGVFLVEAPLAGLAGLLVFLLIVFSWRYVSLGSVAAAAAMPLLVHLLWAPGHSPPLALTLGTFLAFALIVFQHRGNLRRLLNGSEPRYSWGKEKGERP